MKQQNTGVNSCAPEGQTVPAPIVSPVVLLLKDTNILWYGNYASKPVYVNKCKKKHKRHAPTKQIGGKTNRISSFRGNQASTDFLKPIAILQQMFVSFKSSTTGDTIGAGTVCPSGAHEFTPVFCCDNVSQFYVWCFVDHCMSLCPFSFEHSIACPSIYVFWLPGQSETKCFHMSCNRCILILNDRITYDNKLYFKFDFIYYDFTIISIEISK
jgi:hypothetical protein